MTDLFPAEIDEVIWDEACRRADAIRGFLKRNPEGARAGDVAELAAELGLSRRPAPNPVAGLGSGDAPDTKPSSWAGAFAEHTGRAKPQ